MEEKSEDIETFSPQTLVEAESCKFWLMAAECYKFSLKGWIRIHGIHHPNIPATACCLARCLRELGKTNDAIEVLSNTISLWRRDSPDFINMCKIPQHNIPGAEFRLLRLKSRMNVAKEEALALSLWLMSMFFVEIFPNERGRIRALSLLQACSEALQEALKNARHFDNLIGVRCAEMLRIVEDEAKQLFLMQIEDVEQKENNLFDRGDALAVEEETISAVTNDALLSLPHSLVHTLKQREVSSV